MNSQHEIENEFTFSGKIDLTDTYTQSDPIDYYAKLGNLNYVIPEAASSVFDTLIESMPKSSARRLRVLDVGCSYAINAAILRYGFSQAELLARYAVKRARGVRGFDLARSDRAFLKTRRERRPLDFVGLDISAEAVDYGVRSGLLADGLCANFEEASPDAGARAVLNPCDLVISTGAVGYVGAKTFTRILDAVEGTPWVACFVLRQFSFAAIAEAFARRDYVVETCPDLLFAQREFADQTEADAAIAQLGALGRAPTELERSGWLAATAYLARPRDAANARPLSALLNLEASASVTLAAAG